MKAGSLESVQSLPCYGPPLGYMHWHSDADRRHKRGEEQVYCSICNIWAWPSNVRADHKGHTTSSAEFHARVRRMQKQLDQEQRAAERAVDRVRKRRAK